MLGLSKSFHADTITNVIDEDTLTIQPYVYRLDSSAILLKQPTSEKERLIFSDSKLNYKQSVEQKPGLVDAFFEWLSKKLFGHASFKNKVLARRIIYWSIASVALIIMIVLLRRSEWVSLVKPKSKATGFNFNDLNEDLDTINFNARIEEAEALGDYRLAIRWQYLKCLYELDKKGQISFANYKTTINYLYELKTEAVRDGFKEVSKVYEYIWYGEFKITAAHYSQHVLSFNTFHQLIYAQG